MTDQSTVASLWASVTSWFVTPTPSTLFLFLNLVIGTIVLVSRFTSNKKSHHQHQLDSHDSPGQHHQLARAPSHLLLDRVKSINFPLYKFPNYHDEHDDSSFSQPIESTHPVEPEQPPQLARAPSLLDRVKSINFLGYNKFPSPTREEEEPNRFHQPYDTNPVEPEQPRIARAPSLLERVKSIGLPSVYRSQVTDTGETEANMVHKPERSKSETKKSKTKAKENNMKKSVSEKSMRGETTEEETEITEQRRPQTARLGRTVTVGDGDHGVDAQADDFINKFKRQLRLQRLDSLLRYKESKNE